MRYENGVFFPLCMTMITPQGVQGCTCEYLEYEPIECLSILGNYGYMRMPITMDDIWKYDKDLYSNYRSTENNLILWLSKKNKLPDGCDAYIDKVRPIVSIKGGRVDIMTEQYSQNGCVFVSMPLSMFLNRYEIMPERVKRSSHRILKKLMLRRDALSTEMGKTNFACKSLITRKHLAA